MAPRTPKVTRLEDNAEIYKKREPKSEREKLSELDFHGKVEYFKNYYLPKVLAGVAIIGMIVWILVTVLRPRKEEILNVAMINYPISLEDIDQMTSDMNEILNVDPETQTIFFDTAYDLINNDIASYEKLSTYFVAGEIDVFIAPRSVFVKYAFSDSLLSLTDLLPSDLFSAISPDKLLRSKVRIDDEEVPADVLDPDGEVFGIYVQDLSIFDCFTAESLKNDPPVLGVVSTAKNEENSVEYIRYLKDTFGLGK